MTHADRAGWVGSRLRQAQLVQAYSLRDSASVGSLTNIANTFCWRTTSALTSADPHHQVLSSIGPVQWRSPAASTRIWDRLDLA
jgi:hypothetical protein